MMRLDFSLKRCSHSLQTKDFSADCVLWCLMRCDPSSKPRPHSPYLTLTILDTPTPTDDLPVFPGFTFWLVLGSASIILSHSLGLPICPLSGLEKALEGPGPSALSFQLRGSVCRCCHRESLWAGLLGSEVFSRRCSWEALRGATASHVLAEEFLTGEGQRAGGARMDLWLWFCRKREFWSGQMPTRLPGRVLVSGETCPLVTPGVSTVQALSPKKRSSAVYLFIPSLRTASPSETRKAHSRAFSMFGLDCGL